MPNQMEANLGYLPQEVVYDRGGRGKSEIKGVEIHPQITFKGPIIITNVLKSGRSFAGGLQ